MGARPKIEIAKDQLARVQVAWLDPTDWSDLALYAFFALENAVVAAAEYLGIAWRRSHPDKVAIAARLAAQHGLPDVSTLLLELNDLRKSESYGEPRSALTLSAEDVASDVESFVDAVNKLVGGKP